MPEEKKRFFNPNRRRPRRPRGLRLRDAKTGELMLLTVEDGQLSVAPCRKAEPK